MRATSRAMATPLLLLAASFALCAEGPRSTCVVDGDTFWLNGEKVRMADINAPETHGAACPLSRWKTCDSFSVTPLSEGSEDSILHSPAACAGTTHR